MFLLPFSISYVARGRENLAFETIGSVDENITKRMKIFTRESTVIYALYKMVDKKEKTRTMKK